MAISNLFSYAQAQNGNVEFSSVPAESSRLFHDFQIAAVPRLLISQTAAPAPSAVPLPAPADMPRAAAVPIPVPPVTPPQRKPGGNSLTTLVERFRAESGGLAASTREKFDFHFTVAGRYLNFDRDVSSIKLADLRQLKSQLSDKRKPSTVNDIIFKALGALFQIAVDDELIDKSPLEKLKRAKKGEPDRQQPTWDQAQRIAEEVALKSVESGLILKLMLHFGVGQAEIKFLRGEHVAPSEGVVHFRRKKTGKHFDVPIFPQAKSLVQALADEGRLEVSKPVVAWRNPRKALAAACERLDLPLYEPRALRRCFIVHALESGIDPRLVAKWQGHRDAGLIFKVYGKHIDAQHEKRQAAKLGGPREEVPAATVGQDGPGKPMI